jgi:hypothetical protein
MFVKTGDAMPIVIIKATEDVGLDDEKTKEKLDEVVKKTEKKEEVNLKN